MDNDLPRVPTSPPDSFENDEDAREFGRQLAIDSILGELYTEDSVEQTDKVTAFPVWPRIAAAAVVMLGVMVWKFLPGGGQSALAAGWNVEPVGGAEFSIVDPHKIRLERGELLVFSDAGLPLGQPFTVETSNAVASADGTRFYVGTHEVPESLTTTNTPHSEMKKLTRVLILSGTVGLATDAGSAVGNANELLVAENAEKPTNVAVQANSEFAIKLYRELSAKESGNVFFSPFSVSSALAMAAEGARGETALEMGKVLGFPEVARRMGGDAQRIPWEIKKIHSGMAELNALLDGGGKESPEMESARDRIAELRARHEELKRQIDAADKARDFDRVFGLGDEERKVVDELNRLLPLVDQYELQVANALWVDREFPLLAEYSEAISDAYGTGAALPASLRTDPDGVREEINGWVAERTNQRISELLAPGALSPETRMVITNAIYFRGDWRSPFSEGDTGPRDFFRAAGESEKVPTMHKNGYPGGRYGAFEADGSLFATPVRYPENQVPPQYPGEDGFAVFEMPYKGDELSMVVLAPNRIDGLAAIEKSLSADKLNGWISQLKSRRAHVYLPKFEARTSYRLKGALQSMGMARAFVDPEETGGADFSGMAASQDPRDQLFIGEVVHQAFVSVAEKGTEAAAATAVIVEPSDSPIPEVRMIDFTPTFRADRPFLFVIRDKRSGSFLFLGRVAEPQLD